MKQNSQPVESSVSLESPEIFLNREISWLNFARRVLALTEDSDVPLLERIKFVGIMGMLHDEFFMKRIGGLKRNLKRSNRKISVDGLDAAQELELCHAELHTQQDILAAIIEERILPALQEAGIPILAYKKLDKAQKSYLKKYFRNSVQPILTPLAVDAEHPFPFISNLGLNLAIHIQTKKATRFVRLKVPGNRPRWVSLPDNQGFVPLEQIIKANLKILFPQAQKIEAFVFRVTRGAEGEMENPGDFVEDQQQIESIPGSIINQVTNELKARRFAGVVRVQVDENMPKVLQRWLAKQLEVQPEDVYQAASFVGVRDLSDFSVEGYAHLRYEQHTPQVHRRLRQINPDDTNAIFQEIRRGDILLHHPYHDFDTSVLQFIRSAALDDNVLGIKLTIYRTSSDSPIVRALAEAARRGKQVAVLVEVTARFDEAPNIAWGQFLENEGVHVSYGVAKLKTHVKLAMVIREEQGRLHRYLHVGTGNYHSRTARIYEDMGMLTCNETLCDDATTLFNELTGATSHEQYHQMLVAPHTMRRTFVELIQREAAHAREGKPSGIRAKMNQLQDPDIIRELYLASQDGVPIELNVRGLCCLKPGVAGLSENIHLFGVVGRFLEHSRVYRFENDGKPQYFMGSADWMKRNLNRRMESIAPVQDPVLQKELGIILDAYHQDNASVWDCQPDGSYVRRRPDEGEPARSVQELFIDMARRDAQETIARFR